MQCILQSSVLLVVTNARWLEIIKLGQNVVRAVLPCTVRYQLHAKSAPPAAITQGAYEGN